MNRSDEPTPHASDGTVEQFSSMLPPRTAKTSGSTRTLTMKTYQVKSSDGAFAEFNESEIKDAKDFVWKNVENGASVTVRLRPQIRPLTSLDCDPEVEAHVAGVFLESVKRGKWSENSE